MVLAFFAIWLLVSVGIGYWAIRANKRFIPSPYEYDSGIDKAWLDLLFTISWFAVCSALVAGGLLLHRVFGPNVTPDSLPDLLPKCLFWLGIIMAAMDILYSIKEKLRPRFDAWWAPIQKKYFPKKKKKPGPKPLPKD